MAVLAILIGVFLNGKIAPTATPSTPFFRSISEIFDAKVRYTGITLGYQIGAALAGGTAPLVATSLMLQFNDSYVPVACYIIFTAIVSLLAIWAVKERSQQDLDNVSMEDNHNKLKNSSKLSEV